MKAIKNAVKRTMRLNNTATQRAFKRAFNAHLAKH